MRYFWEILDEVTCHQESGVLTPLTSEGRGAGFWAHPPPDFEDV